MGRSGISSVPPRGTVTCSTRWPSIVRVQVDDVSPWSAVISCTVLGKPQMVSPASRVKAWSTGRCTMKEPSAEPSAGASTGRTKSVSPTSR